MEYKLINDSDEPIVAVVCDGIIMMASRRRDPLTMWAAITLGGDRHACCDEAVVAWDGGVPAGIATIAPDGENGGGPEVIGLFVLEAHRRHGVGTELLMRALARIRERGLGTARLDILSKPASALVKKLPPDVLAGVAVRDQSHRVPF